MDTSIINGYAEMTTEEKLKALEGYEIPKPDMSGYVTKATFDKTASELSEAKKKLTENLSEAEKKELEKQQEFEDLKNKIAELEAEKKKSELVSKYIANGYSSELAEETATAFIDGDTDTVFANQAKFLKLHDEAYKAELMKNTPTPPNGGGNKTITKEDLRKMSASERYAFSQENPDAYKEIYSGGNT